MDSDSGRTPWPAPDPGVTPTGLPNDEGARGDRRQGPADPGNKPLAGSAAGPYRRRIAAGGATGPSAKDCRP